MVKKIPTNLYYSKEHEWVKIENKIAWVGITDFAQNSLGDIVFVELPDSGKDLSSNQSFGVVESIKSVSDLFSPLSGKVLEVNSDLISSPEKINSDPYSAWMIKIAISNPEEVRNLLSDKDYEEFCENL